MSTDIRTWRCGKCPYTVDIPQEDTYTLFIDTLMRIREHRFAHLVSALEKASDEELMGMSEDGWMEQEDTFGGLPNTEPVQYEDVEPVLAGVTELLKADLPRARRIQNNG